jgi:hypothetical protein
MTTDPLTADLLVALLQDEKISRRQNSAKSSGAITGVSCLKITNISETINF